MGKLRRIANDGPLSVAPISSHALDRQFSDAHKTVAWPTFWVIEHDNFC
jgi:hypothetical protein